MTDILARTFGHYTKGFLSHCIRRHQENGYSLTSKFKICAVYYSKRNAKNQGNPYKVVKSKVRQEDKSGTLGVECSPNWQLLRPKGNRFYFPNEVGPAWQGVTTTLPLEEPLESLVDLEGKKINKKKLQVWVSECPRLIKKSMHELFPSPEVVNSRKIALIVLSFDGNCEDGALKFVLAAREITSRLRLHGFWADFMNPFSGKPFFSWSNGKSLYRIDSRFRGINMKVNHKENCTVISPENGGNKFSAIVYTNAPCNFVEIKNLLNTQV